MSLVSECKICEIDGWLGSEVEGIDETLDSSSDGMICEDEEEICSGWRSEMMMFSLSNPCKKMKTFSSKMRK